jgi:Na+-translocating ferredoxin:NAD+ oxidoreductase RnfA subunit
MKTMWHGSKLIFCWVAVMMTLNAFLPLAFWSHVEARVVLGVFVVSAMGMMALFHAFGFTRITGLGHTLWVLLVPWLVSRLDVSDGITLFQGWMLATITVNGISLAIDAWDVVRYVRGERQPVLPTVE